MKTDTHVRRARNAVRPLAAVGFWGIGVGLFLLSAASLPGAVTVKTLGGGPLVIGGPNNGFVDGPTLQESQFNHPIVNALDPAGFLYVADRDNNAVRRMDIAGDRSTTYLSDLNLPVGLVFDSATNLYVINQGDGSLRKFDRFRNPVSVLAVFDTPSAITIDSRSNLYIAELTGSIQRMSPDGSIIRVASGFNEPRGLAVLNGNGLLAVSELHAIQVVNLTNFGVFLLAGSTVEAGFLDGTGTAARFDTPEQIAATPSGALVVADHFNHRMRLVEMNGTVSTLYGIDPGTWASDFPGWEDGSVEFAEAREPVGVAVDRAGVIYTSEVFYHIVRQVTGAPTGPSGTGGDGTGTTNVVIVPPPTFGPFVGFFPMGTSIIITSSVPDVFFTVDGSVPTTNSMRVTILNGVGTVQFNEALRDLTSFCVRAFTSSNASEVVCGTPSPVSEIGFSRDVVAGIGATAIVPVTINLRTNDTLQSIQFRVEVTPVSGNRVPISDEFEALSITTNDLIRVATADANTGSSSFDTFKYRLGETAGVVITFIGTNSNFSIRNFAVVAMMAIPIPPSAREGDTYRITVVEPSGTSDGRESDVLLSTSPPRTLRVQNIPYLVGDAAPSRWYNAGDFGDGDLRNNDVNNAFIASLGVRTPYAFSDLFNAMDAYPEDRPGEVGGDGALRFLDWQVTLFRSLRLDPENWQRVWSIGGERVPIPTTIRSSRATTPAQSITARPGSVWVREAALGATPLGMLNPNSVVDVPIYLNVAPSASIAGLQFRAMVTADGDAPPLDAAAQFVPAFGVRVPRRADGLSLNEVGCAWNIGGFSPALQGSNLLGHLRFKIPAAARGGSSYRVSFPNADGAPDLQTQYNLESFGGAAWVQVVGNRASDTISAEWKQHFFGGATAQAAADVDADHDGSSNFEEYLAGTHPVLASSRLRLAAEPRINGARKEIALRWLSAPGKKYVLESSTDLRAGNWKTVTSNILGTGDINEYLDSNSTGAALFYRIRLMP